MLVLQRYISCFEGEEQQDLQAAYSEASTFWSESLRRSGGGAGAGVRGGLAGTGGCTAAEEEGATLEELRRRVAQRAEGAELEKRLGVMARREDQRMKHALTRLHNHYKDVRTPTNNGVWPLGQTSCGLAGATDRRINATGRDSPQHMHLLASSASQGGGAVPRIGTAPLDAALQPGSPVAFYSDAQQIQTPKAKAGAAQALTMDSPFHQHPNAAALASPFGPDGGAGTSRPSPQHQTHHSDSLETSPSLQLHGAVPSAVLEAAKDMEDRGAAVSYISSLIHSPHHGDRSPGAAGARGPGSAAYSTARLRPKTSLLEPIEPVDPTQALLQLAQQLPALKLPC